MYRINDIVLFKHRNDLCKSGKIVSVCGVSNEFVIVEVNQDVMNIVALNDVLGKNKRGLVMESGRHIILNGLVAESEDATDRL